MHQYASRLEIKPYQVITIALLSSTVGCAFVFTVAKTTVFPVPFAALVATPPIVIAMFSCCVLFWGKQWKAAPPSLQFDVKRHLAVLIAELSLTFVYPVFILGFVSLSGVAQSLFAVALPFIKLAGKNVISRLVGDRNDVKPEIVIFNVEVFHALYVAAALQGATSYTSTTMIMIVDLAQFWISMHDVAQVVSEIENLMQKIPLDHPAAAMNFVQIALSLQVPTLEKHATIMDSLSCSVDGGIVQKVGGNSANGRQMTPVVPSNTPSRSSKRLIIGKVQVVPAAPFHWKDVDLNAIFTPEERSRLLSKTLHVLFITEYLVLAEYTEVMLPLIYCIHRVVLFNLPNCSHYPSLAELSSEQFAASTQNVLVYSGLELASLVLLVFVLQRTLGISPLSQLAFVLESQAGMIQAQLTLWFSYVMQVPLLHNGADFSFKFQWIRNAH